jgi:hypothetical protein
MLRRGAPPKWKMQKYTVPEFEAFMGSVDASVRYAFLFCLKRLLVFSSSDVVSRYDTLELCGNVNIRYQPDKGTFKMSGSYGAPRHMSK